MSLTGHDAVLVHHAARVGILPGNPLLTPVLHHGAACASFASRDAPCDCAPELRIGDARLRFADVPAWSAS